MFKKTLSTVVERADGSIGALIMGTDGIAVEQVLPQEGQEANLDIVAAELTTLVRSAQTIGLNTGLDGLREVMISFESANVIIRLLTSEYFIVLAMKPDSNLGRGRYELRKAELILNKEFQI